MHLHWDGNNSSLEERNRSAALGAGVTPRRSPGEHEARRGLDPDARPSALPLPDRPGLLRRARHLQDVLRRLSRARRRPELRGEVDRQVTPTRRSAPTRIASTPTPSSSPRTRTCSTRLRALHSLPQDVRLRETCRSTALVARALLHNGSVRPPDLLERPAGARGPFTVATMSTTRQGGLRVDVRRRTAARSSSSTRASGQRERRPRGAPTAPSCRLRRRTR